MKYIYKCIRNKYQYISINRYGFLNENFRSSLCGGCACGGIADPRHQVHNDLIIIWFWIFWLWLSWLCACGEQICGVTNATWSICKKLNSNFHCALSEHQELSQSCKRKWKSRQINKFHHKYRNYRCLTSKCEPTALTTNNTWISEMRKVTFRKSKIQERNCISRPLLELPKWRHVRRPENL